MRAAAATLCLLLAACGAQPSPTASPPATDAPSPSPFASPIATTAAPPATGSPVPTTPPIAAIEDELITAGTLTACMSIVGAPATALDEEGQLVGYNVSFAEEIALRLGLELATTEPLFDDLLESIQGHECDISVSSQNITASRLTLVNFVAYTESVQPVLVAIGNPNGVEELSDLCGQTVSATEGTTHVDLVNGAGDYVGQGLNEACAAAGQPAIELQTFQTESHAVSALLAGDVAAYLGNPSFAAQFPEQIEYSNATLPPARQGITTAKDRPVLSAATEATVSAMIADGAYRAILVRHLPNDESVKIVSIVE